MVSSDNGSNNRTLSTEKAILKAIGEPYVPPEYR